MLRRWLADMSLFGAIAAALFVLRFGFILAEWPELDAKDRQRGPQRSNGIASDSFHGVDHTLDVPSRAPVEGA